ncbi:hypothetical protein ACFSQT_21500 [Mesorhizobium calcicola]|uniref:Uncharacterized protein n=1 Tax=Mesorhizobium calcicola TaxID=1300310 RepID=A0ABW4WHJ8_9HYPH
MPDKLAANTIWQPAGRRSDGTFRIAAKGINANRRKKNRPILSIVRESKEFANSENSSMKSKPKFFDSTFVGIVLSENRLSFEINRLPWIETIERE